MKLRRRHYLQKIEPFIGKPIIKILVGMRRVGKSELLLQLQEFIEEKYPEKHIVFINKENRRFDNIKTNEETVEEKFELYLKYGG